VLSFFEGLCDPRITAIESWMGDGRTYVFNADNFWRLDDSRRKFQSDRGYPRKISSKWKGVPDDLDAVFLWGHNFNTYFFKGDQYYKYNDFSDTIYSNYPQSISQGWPGLPADGIDAAFTWSNDVSYFFKGDYVYKYDNVNDQVASGYPTLIANEWPGIPNNIDSAFCRYKLKNDGTTYFFKDEYYWKWDDKNNQVIGPRFIDNDWKNICNV